jgi:hypothetical protein
MITFALYLTMDVRAFPSCRGRTRLWFHLMSLAALEVLRKKERQDETQFTTKIGGKTSLSPPNFDW